MSNLDCLVYLSLGNGPHIDEVRFSVLSAFSHRRPKSSWRIVIYTDNQQSLEGLQVEFRHVDSITAASWTAPHGVFYRSKIKALEASLRAGASRSVLIDGDTYFRRSPDELFDRIAPGASILHLREGPPAPPVRAAIRHVLEQHVPVDLDGTPWGLTEETTIWNAGVLGLHRTDVALCERALRLMDQLEACDFHRYSHVSEQIALTMCFGRYTRIKECMDVLVHYWPSEIRQPFRIHMTRVYQNPLASTYVALWPHRPRFGLTDRVKLRVKRAARRVGVELTLGLSLMIGFVAGLLAIVAGILLLFK